VARNLRKKLQLPIFVGLLTFLKIFEAESLAAIRPFFCLFRGGLGFLGCFSLLLGLAFTKVVPLKKI
jgi:hypothetical protein